LQNFGAIWPILSLDQAISSLIRQQNNPFVLIMFTPMMPIG
jgi:hypothetical protein